jgi:hypothetical protein
VKWPRYARRRGSILKFIPGQNFEEDEGKCVTGSEIDQSQLEDMSTEWDGAAEGVEEEPQNTPVLPKIL